MVDYRNAQTEQNLSLVFKALSDATRRELLKQLCQQGPSRVTDLANYYDMSLNAISKHIKVLEKARLVQRRKVGRIHWIEADLNQTTSLEEWFVSLKSIWALRLDNLNAVFKKGD